MIEFDEARIRRVIDAVEEVFNVFQEERIPMFFVTAVPKDDGFSIKQMAVNETPEGCPSGIHLAISSVARILDSNGVTPEGVASLFVEVMENERENGRGRHE